MPFVIDKLDLEIKVGREYKLEELKSLGYELRGTIQLSNNRLYNELTQHGKRFDKKNEIILAVQTNDILKVIEYYNLEKGLNITFIGNR